MSEVQTQTQTMEPTWTSQLWGLHACSAAIEWASQYPSLDAAWAACERGDWMLWLAGRLSGPPESESRRRLVAAACECARLSLPAWEQDYPEDRAPHVAIETAERWTRGEATLEEVRSAAYVASDAAYTASTYAAYAASAAAYVAYASADYASDAALAARAGVLGDCADIVRRHYPEPPAIEEE